jgi:mono/diheme cytochrome c family protein
MAARMTVPPPDLTATVSRRSDGYLYATIRDGGPIMPSQRERVAPRERWDVVNFLRSIAAPGAELAPAVPVTENAPPMGQPPAAPQPALAGDAERGGAVFEARCQICHAPDTNEALVGPGLKGLFQWPPHSLSDGTEHRSHDVDVIRRQIVEGGGEMAPVGARLSDQEIADLLAYLQTL